MQQPIGEFIRQARRQQNITQTALGGKRFSKSYVSAVERNKIASSTEALHFFAEQLGQPSNYFTSLLQQVGNGRQVAVLNGPGPLSPNEQAFPDEAVTLLDILLENTELYDLPTRYELPTLSPEVIAALPPAKQARYHFLTGLIAKGKQDPLAARQAFESALTLAPADLQVPILDELGVNYYSTRAYQTALSYQLRALHLLRNASFNDIVAALEFKVELHSGDDYRALGEYKQACEHYEHARSRLSSEHDMKTAGLLYWRLGYCTYAAIQQDTALSISADKRATAEAMEREFPRAISFLLQSRILYQVCSDKMQEARARLAQALTLLDFCDRRRQLALSNGKSAKTLSIANSISLLGEAEEQCRQVLMSWQNAPGDATALSTELDATIYAAVVYLIRVFIERASLARLDGNKDTVFREQAMASYLCQQVLDSLLEDALPWTLMRNAITLQSANIAFQPPSLPRLPVQPNGHNPFPRSPLSQVEVYFAVGEVAEELGRAATEGDYARDCFARANRCFQASLSIARSSIQDEDIEPNYIVRCYQRCICLLEERMLVAPDFAADTGRILVDILEEAFHQLRYSPILPA